MLTPQRRRVSSTGTLPSWSMATSPHLSRKIRDALGNDAGSELVDVLDRVSNDISELRGDVAELRHQMEVGFARVDARFEQLHGQIHTTFEKSLRDQTRFFFLAWAAMLAAIVGLYGR
jgi:hypothetical protein